MSATTVSVLKPIFKGLLTWLPGIQRAFYNRHAGGATTSAKYCYGVWLKHLSLLWRSGLQSMPHSILELGPGESLGTGLAALLCGAQRYAAIDVVRHASVTSTRPVLRELTTMFQNRAPRPVKGWPDYDAELDARLFPSAILPDEDLAHTLKPSRVAQIGAAVERLDFEHQHPMVRYATWGEPEPMGAGEADLIFSHVVMGLVESVDPIYGHCARWLRRGGWMSHQIDLTSHGVTDEWNGHLRYSDAAWTAIAGRRPLFVNRERVSAHVRLIEKNGFEVISVLRRIATGGIARNELAPRWRDISDEDLNCSTAFIVARKNRLSPTSIALSSVER
jgi:hypothetical protein